MSPEFTINVDIIVSVLSGIGALMMTATRVLKEFVKTYTALKKEDRDHQKLVLDMILKSQEQFITIVGNNLKSSNETLDKAKSSINHASTNLIHIQEDNEKNLNNIIDELRVTRREISAAGDKIDKLNNK